MRVMLDTPPSYIHSFFTISVPYELPSRSPYPGSAASRLPSLATKNEPSDNTVPDTSSPSSFLLSAYLSVKPGTQLSDMLSFMQTQDPYKISSGSQYPRSTPSEEALDKSAPTPSPTPKTFYLHLLVWHPKLPNQDLILVRIRLMLDGLYT